ncbi:hypothetical protein CLV84_3488 [Neolewinella xylanilytica]|uniref:Uncharacterized protein n=1 Tax=Neolewinella xylanilytica TaxID=1514080 RepID=A0A2S6I5X3_9BACT|nr:hypothetical protein CLV84_3488 [Neolewinella xylanilytica]
MASRSIVYFLAAISEIAIRRVWGIALCVQSLKYRSRGWENEAEELR